MLPACAGKDLFDSFSRMRNEQAGNMRNFAVSNRKNWGYCVITFSELANFPRIRISKSFPTRCRGSLLRYTLGLPYHSTFPGVCP
jgi:hypothetical protein